MSRDGAGDAESLTTNATGSRMQRRKVFPFEAAGFPRRATRPGTRALLGRWGALLLMAVAAGAMFAPPAAAGSRNSRSGRISFYGDIGSLIDSPYRENPLLVRFSTLFLTEDGSVALVDLRWSGWGTSVARATGVWSASNCTPNCATGKRTTRPARLTLSSPGLVGGHRVYRCFRIDPPHPQRDIEDNACIRQQGTFYGYDPVTAPAPSAPTSAAFYSVPGWYCAMNTRRVSCEYEGPNGKTVHLSPSGKIATCHTSPTTANPNPCNIGSPGLGTPLLKLGKQITVRPFRCEYSTVGLTCVAIETGRGFLIYKTTVTRLGP